MTFPACLLSACVVSFLLFGPYLARLMDEGNRISYMWARQDAFWVALACVIPAFVFTFVHALLRRVRREFPRRAWEHLLVAGFGAGLLANLCFWMQREEGYRIGQHGPETRTLWLLMVAVVGYSLARPGSRLVLRTRQACQILTPVMLIVFVQLFRASTYPTRVDPLPVRPHGEEDAADRATGASAVYLFVLDGWSYQRSFENGLPIEAMPRLRDFAEDTITFHEARSMGDHTSASVPRLMFQTDLPEFVSAEQAGFKRQDVHVDAMEFASIFDGARRHGYSTAVVGFSLPYERWLDGRVDALRTYCRYARGRHSAARVFCHQLEAASYWTDPWSEFTYRKLKTRVADEQILHGYAQMREDVHEVIRKMPDATMALFHLPFPHYPYIVDEEGRYRGPNDADWYSDSVEGYRRNLVYMDRLMGEFFDAMKDAGRYERAMLIVTSDHTWRFDPERLAGRVSAPKTHVPLLIKWPGQEEPVSVKSTFRHLHLGALIHSSLEGESLARGLEQIERHLAEDAGSTPDKASVREAIVRK